MKLQNILRNIRQADQDFHLIEDGDKVAVALSGGKDSMLLFLALAQYQKFKGKNFELLAIHVDPGFDEELNVPMEEFARKHGLELHIVNTRIYPILQQEQHLHNGKIQCSLCSTLKKGTLFDTAKELGCNKVAFGHHGDDAIETLLLNMVHGAKVATFRPDQYMSRTDMHLIRPLVYCFEDEIKEACALNDVPAARKVCPNDGFTQRESMKDIVSQLAGTGADARKNLLKALGNQEQILLWKPDSSWKHKD